MKLKTGIAIGALFIFLNSCGDKNPIDAYQKEAKTKEELSYIVNNFENNLLMPTINYQNTVDSLNILLDTYATSGGSKQLNKNLIDISNEIRNSGYSDAEQKYQEISEFSYKQFYKYKGDELIKVNFSDISSLNPNEKLRVWEYFPIKNTHNVIRDDIGETTKDNGGEYVKNKSVPEGDKLIMPSLAKENKISNNTKQQTIKQKSRNHLEELFTTLNYLSPDTDFIMYIEKESNTLNLYQKESNMLKYVADYKTTDGVGGRGPKEKEGDKRTPEGVYKILKTASTVDSGYQVTPIFGEGKIWINYPSVNDLKKGRTGEGVLICGTSYSARLTAIKNGLDITSSSVVLTNNDISDLLDKIKGYENNTLVVIESKNRPLGIEDYGGNL